MSESRYKSFIKPVKFWGKSQQQDIDETIEAPLTTKKSHSSRSLFGKKSQVLIESGKLEVYKLSNIDDAGLYMPPSPTLEGKRDHWIEEEDMTDFHLPSPDCLTTHDGNKHDFFTPSSFVQSQPYILPIAGLSDSTLSTVPSLDDASSDMSFS